MNDPRNSALLDMEQIEELLFLDGGRGGVLEKFVAAFNTHVPETIATLRAAVEAADFAAINASAHKMKGSAGNLGASHLAGICLKLEMAGKNKDSTALPELMVAIDNGFAASGVALQALLDDIRKS